MESGNGGDLQCLAGVSGGRLIVSGPSGEESGEGAVVTPGEGILLRVNGLEVTESFQIYPRDTVEVVPLKFQVPARVEVRVAPDGMAAEAVYYPPLIISYVIPDQPPAPALIISAVKSEENAGSGSDLSLEEIKIDLQANGVVFGLDDEALPGLLSDSGSWQQVAAGRPPVPGRDGYIEPLFKMGLQRVDYDHGEVRVDYRKRYEIPQVEKGRVIARVYPPRSGVPGMTVRGEEIPPKPVYPVEVRCEAGAALGYGGGEIRALCTGVPLCRRRGKQVLIGVDDIYRHQGDVDMESGHLVFEGHLRIAGGIKEGLRVRADGDLEIEGNSSGAEITAGGNVIFRKNCVKCRVRAGSLSLQIKEFNLLCSDLIDKLDLAVKIGRELIDELQRRGSYTESQINIMLRSLMQKKIPDLLEQSKKTYTSSRALPLEQSGTMGPALKDLYRYLQGGGRPFSLQGLKKLYDSLTGEGLVLRGAGRDDASISVHYVQNSDLCCPGNIHVGGPGAYNSIFVCGGEVHVDRIFRGGSIKAEGDIYIGEAGVPRPTKMQGLIETDSGRKIRLGRVYENTRIKIGKPELCLENNLSNVQLFLDQEGDIRISPWS